MATTELKKDLETLKLYLGKNKEKSNEMIETIKSKYHSKEEIEMIDNFIREGLTNLTSHLIEFNKMVSLKMQIEPIKNKINLSYIAETYFKKSKVWISQRINNHIVNGKPVSFTDKEIEIFNKALKEYGNEIASFQLKV